MQLSLKAIRFLIDALDHYGEHLDHRLEDVSLSEDELADLGNDRQYVAALVDDLRSHHEELVKGQASLQH